MDERADASAETSAVTRWVLHLLPLDIFLSFLLPQAPSKESTGVDVPTLSYTQYGIRNLGPFFHHQHFTTPVSTTLLDLPTEIHQLIAQCLDFGSLMRLKMTCRHFHALIPPLRLDQMLEVEISDIGKQKDLYTCRDCLRLRPRAKFADKMVKKKKAKFATGA